MNWVCRSGIGYIRVKEETAGMTGKLYNRSIRGKERRGKIKRKKKKEEGSDGVERLLKQSFKIIN